MKEEDLSLIKRYSIVEYLERKGIKPVRRTPSYALYRSPLREETHPSFKVDTQKNLWIDYAEGRGGSIIDLCMRLDGCTLSEAICRLGQNASDNTVYSSHKDFSQNNLQPTMAANETRKLISISGTLPPHLQEYLTKVRCIDLEKAKPFLKCISYEVRDRRYQAIGFANLSGGYELRDNHSFKGTIAPKDITPIFTDKIINQIEPTCVFEGFMDFLSFLSMKEEVTNACIVLNSVSNTAKAIRYMNAQGISFIRTFLDNDDAGRRAVQEFAGAGFHVEDMSIHYKDFKDLNEFHVSRVRERQKHKGQIQAHMSVTDQNQNKSNIKSDREMKKKTMMNDKDLLWFLDNQDDEMDNEVIPQTEAQPVPIEETTTDVEMNEDSITQGEADITSGKSEHTRHTENMAVQRRISSKMRKKTLEAYKQAYLVPTKLSNRKAVYLSRETQERADFIVRRLGDRGSNLSSFVENIVRLHLEEYGEDIEKWRRL